MYIYMCIYADYRYLIYPNNHFFMGISWDKLTIGEYIYTYIYSQPLSFILLLMSIRFSATVNIP